MKKLFIILLLVFISFCPLWAYELETSRGTVTLTVPEGYNLEQAFCAMGKLYLEEKWANEEATKATQKLIEASEAYIKENEELKIAYNEVIEEYNDLVKNYEDLNLLYTQKAKIDFIRPYIGGSWQKNYFDNKMAINMNLGFTIGRKLLIYGSAGTERFGVGLGFIL